MTLTSSGLTFSNDEIVRTLSAAGFQRVQPQREISVARNELWVPECVNAIIKGETTAPFPHWRADALLCRFIYGYDLGFSLLGDPSGKHPEVERLTELDEAWAICFRSPRPGWRLFGRFFGAGSFIGIALHDRHKLSSKTNYHSKAEAAMHELSRLLPGVEPTRGNEPRDYWHGASRDVDAPTAF